MNRRQFIKYVPAFGIFVPQLIRAAVPKYQAHKRKHFQPAPAAGGNNTVLEFDASSDFLSFTSFNSGLPYSVGGWVQRKASSDSYGMIVGDASDANGWYIRGGSGLMVIFEGGDKANDTALSNDTWYHIVGSVSGAGMLTWYRNGVADGDDSGLDGITSLARIGDVAVGGAASFRGKLAQVYVRGAETSSGEAASLAAKTTTPADFATLAYWKMNDFADGASGDGGTVLDYSGNGRHATATGTTGRTADF